MTEIVLGVAMFTAVILALIALLMAARSKLVATGDVTITINEDPDKALRVPAGARSSSPRPAAARAPAGCARWW